MALPSLTADRDIPARNGGRNGMGPTTACRVQLVTPMRNRCICHFWPLVCVNAALGIRAAAAQQAIDSSLLEQNEAVIGAVNIRVDNVFDLSNPEENKKLYRFANRVHIPTRPSTVENVLLFEEGDSFSQRLLDETARALRSRGFVAEAELTPASYNVETNAVDVDVVVKDAWSLTPEIKLGRKGGENEVALGVNEENLFGLGKDVTVAYSSDVDRDQVVMGYADGNVRGTRTRLDFGLENNSDGERQSFLAERPFYAIDSRWSVGSLLINDERIDSMYGLGEVIDEFRHDSHRFSIHGGWSRGIVDRRARRWLFGMSFDEDSFRPTAESPDTLLLPENRKLVYPWFGFQLVEDDFREMTELNDMGRTEDVALGLNFRVQLGFSTESLGADRNAPILSTSVHKGWEPGGPGRLLLVDAAAEARQEDGHIRNSSMTSQIRYYRRNLGKHLFSASLTTVVGNELDLERQVLLGGDNDLRGYPLRYQSGEKSATLTLEQRFFTDWYPFRLLRVGYAVFYDVGRVWGDDPRGVPNRGTLSDFGVGLRLTSPRASGDSVVHIDLAFPVNAPSDIDSVQLIVEKKRSF
jgi:hypothetical protein